MKKVSAVRRALAAGLMALAMCVGVAGVGVAPANAGDGYWSLGCRGDVSWYGIPGQGSWYYHEGDSAAYWVGGGWYQVFAAAGYECAGGIGYPRENAHYAPNIFGNATYGQRFSNGCIWAFPSYPNRSVAHLIYAEGYWFGASGPCSTY